MTSDVINALKELINDKNKDLLGVKRMYLHFIKHGSSYDYDGHSYQSRIDNINKTITLNEKCLDQIEVELLNSK